MVQDGTPSPFLGHSVWAVPGRPAAHAAYTGADLPGFTAGQTPDAVSPYGTGNLGLNVQDDPAVVQARRARIATPLGVAPDHLLLPRQVHGSDVAVVDGPWDDAFEVDALVTATPGLVLGVTVADCVPVMLVDGQAGVVGVAHAGRRGMAAGIVTKTLQAMAGLGAREVSALLGPSICARCYEVSQEVWDEVVTQVPVSGSFTGHATPSIDVAAGVLSELAGRCAQVEVCRGCTLERDDLFSYRRDGRTGRFAGLVWLEPEQRT